MIRALLVIFNGFLALTAAGGGICLILGLYSPPVDLLQGSPFSSYLIPGLSLLFLVGGSGAVATIMLALHHPRAFIAVFIAGLAILAFELIEILTVRSPAGVARNLQILYVSLGLAIVFLALRSSDRKS
jgi:ABC-type proline/glycine betaine transport system permease subunit